MSGKERAGFYWGMKELQNKKQISKSRERERQIVKKMSEEKIQSMHADYLIMIAKEAEDKKISRHDS